LFGLESLHNLKVVPLIDLVIQLIIRMFGKKSLKSYEASVLQKYGCVSHKLQSLESYRQAENRPDTKAPGGHGQGPRKAGTQRIHLDSCDKVREDRRKQEKEGPALCYGQW